jgi:predicted secreted hydrolase
VLVALLTVGCARPVQPLPPVPTALPTPPPPVELPRDALPHDALTEWWYYTGHLSTDDAREYGFEFTVFQVRRQNAPTGYLAHFAITDILGQRFSHQARFAQGEARTAFPIDVGGWTLDSDTIDATMQPGPGVEAAYRLRLRMVEQKPPALHHGGYIDMGAPGGSYYYSRTRMAVDGELGRQHVTGQAWMDHQWGDFVIAGGGGWDWYSLQLDDRSELMLYVIRDAAGQLTGVYGTEVLPDGTARELAPNTITAIPLGRWTSPHTGATYPSGWRLMLSGGERLDITPVLQDQELYFPGFGGTIYWEGAVRVDGDRHGVGYVELTGYAGS